MADKKISALTAASTPLAGTEVLPIVQSGSTVKVAVSDLTAGRAVSASSLSTTGDVYVGANAPAFAEKLRVFGNYAVLDNGTYTGFIGAGGSIGAGGATDFSLRSQAGMAFAVGGTTLALQFSAAANVTVNTGNLVIGTAAKGIDFSANTGTAGMTSELLNWYEEGTWTPDQGSGLTVVGAFSSTGRYTRIGRQITVTGQVSGATSVLVGASGIISTNLPYASGIDTLGIATNSALSVVGGVFVSSGSANLFATVAIGATPTIYFQVTYFV